MKNLLLTLQVTALTLGLCVGCKEKDNKVPPTPTPEIEEDLLSGTYVPSLNINANGELELPVTFFHIVYTENYRQFLAQGTSYTMRDESELPKYETGSFYWTHIIVSFKKETSGN